MLNDRYGNIVSTASRAALAYYDDALELTRLYRGDPIAAIDAALAEDPEFGSAWALRAGLLVQQTDKAFSDEVERSLRAGATARLTEGDGVHLSAAKDWVEGRYHDGTRRLASLARNTPRDLLAVQFTHTGCFFLGLQAELRDIPLQALRAFDRGDDGYGVLLGMAAFGLEECGDLFRAETFGREAVLIDPRDGWAVHAVAHVNEMRGDLETGIPWLAEGAKDWAPDSGFAYHNWWHLALLYLDAGNTEEILRLYDQCVRPDPNAGVVLEGIDASALLWRLYLEGVDVTSRFQPLAAAWERCAEDAFYAFNDLHALMAFAGAGRSDLVQKTLKAMRQAAAGEGDNAYLTRSVGLPLAEGFAAFGAGNYGDAAAKILEVRACAQRLGGSHAQRDILTLTALHAALRGGLASLAEALSAERLEHKPLSPWARRLQGQAIALRGIEQLELAN